MKKKTLTWDELAEFYKTKTGMSARIKQMDAIYNWAIEQDEIEVLPDGSLVFKKNK